MQGTNSTILLLGLIVFIVACGSAATPEPTMPPTPLLSPTPPTQTSPGQQLFVSKGCAACHGQNAEGTNIAPALSGHTSEQVERQIRAPVGVMPLFPKDKVSDEELGEIIEYIEGLEGEHTHMGAPVTADDLAMHHWMALFAIDAGNMPEAVHHGNHIIDMTEGQHLARIQEAMALLEAGNAHEAEHIIEEMVAGIESTGLDQPTMHLTMALSALRVDDSVQATHHMDHFLDMADPDLLVDGRSILALMHEGKVRDAEHQLEDFMGHVQGLGGADEHQDDMHSEPLGGHP